MADSAVAITAGSGTSIDTRTEATNGNHRQVVVLGDPSTNAGVAPVDATNGLSVDVKAIAAGDNNIGNVDIVSVPSDPFGANADAAATAGSTGTMQAKLRLITSQLDSIKTAVETLDNTVGGSELQVDVVGSLPAGTNAIGKLASNSGVDIGDVDVLSIAAGDNNIGNVDVVTVPADPFGANADAAATAGSTGSIQAKLRLVTSQLDSIKTAVETLDNAISGSEMQVDVVTMPTVTETNSAAIAASLSVLDDWDNAASDGASVSGDVAHGSADAGEPVSLGLNARTTNPTAVDDADRVRGISDDVGRQVVLLNHVRDLTTHTTTTITNSTAETTILAAGAAGVLHDLTQLVITNASATAVSVTIKDDTAGTTRMIVDIAANGGAVLNFPVPVIQAVAAKPWTATLSVNTVTVHFFVQAVKNV